MSIFNYFMDKFIIPRMMKKWVYLLLHLFWIYGSVIEFRDLLFYGFYIFSMNVHLLDYIYEDHEM